ncbi:hypothetical protein BHE90_009238 [Fusarium euwallaceae]|uniref:Uncharacterized protein n=2 Tax=Fusarium solani species complex TaxID=232080 RepID=A0A430LKQ1_9HYPO|nr:hypothetical protein CDV31_015768 [Fusarium ambrosium]RTE76281.1 hypothetical protein BHE90_009238 [Fusarium euwallaceae]
MCDISSLSCPCRTTLLSSVSSWFYRPAAAKLARRPWSQIRFLFPIPWPIPSSHVLNVKTPSPLHWNAPVVVPSRIFWGGI